MDDPSGILDTGTGKYYEAYHTYATRLGLHTIPEFANATKFHRSLAKSLIIKKSEDFESAMTRISHNMTNDMHRDKKRGLYV